MTRSELGALVSRALAVWIACELIASASQLMQAFGATSTSYVWAVMGSVFLRLILCAILWFCAGSFGTWVGPEPDAPITTSSLSKPVVAAALIQGIAAYWAFWGVAQCLTSAAFNGGSGSMFLDVIERNQAYYWGTFAFIALSVGLLFKAKAIAGAL